MCGRFYLAVELENLLERYDIVDGEINYIPRYNIAPTQQIPVIINQDGENRIKLFSWGLIPHWAKDASFASKMINARAETLATKPSFKDAFLSRRCIIPASGFYEWDKSRDKKQPFSFHLKSGGIMSLAGLWDRWQNPNGEVIYTFAIITTDPNDVIEPFHHRMAAILNPEDESKWLDPENRDMMNLAALLKPYPSGKLTYHRVSEAVNSVRNDDSSLIEPVVSEEQLMFEL
ncbi:MAG: SOS response-associated peptidase [Bacillota bacterium]